MSGTIPFDTPWLPGSPIERLLQKLGWVLAALDSFPAAEPVTRVPAKALQERDPDAWSSLFEAEMPAIFRYVRSRMGDPETAEDITGEVFEEAWRHAGTYEDRGLPPRAWLFGIARNVVASHRRRWFRRPPHLSLEAYDRPVEDQLSAEMLDLLRAVEQLPGSQAEVVTLRFVHGLNLEETAAALNTTVDAVKARQARALTRLRELCAVA